jgi:signal transduction histidine kinase
MFSKATFRLTAWYVAILMVLSLIFSAWLYMEATQEVRTGLNAQLLRPFVNVLPREEVATYLNSQYDASRMRIIGSLVLLNVSVLVAGSLISYWLARRQLQPIERALEAQNRFTADASHELRTPLTTMKTELEVALRNDKLTAKDAKALLKSNEEEIDRLSNLVDGLLVLARNGDKPKVVITQLAPITQKAVDRFVPLAKHRHITLERQITDVSALADAQHVDTILGVLLDNAIKYSPQKSIVTTALAVYDNAACLTVHNEGAGIPAQVLPHIFERFYRADTSRTGGEKSGHGLGLSIAEKLTQNMNGSIAVRSSAKAGTTFTVRLPVA